MTVLEMRNQLVKLGLSQEEADNIKGKSDLQTKIEELSQLNGDVDILDDLINNLDPETTQDNKISDEEEVEPTYNSEEWSDFVLSKFTDDELIDGNPNVNGLRRICNLLLGSVVKSYPRNIIQIRDGVSCTYEIHVAWCRNEAGELGMGEYGVRMFGGAADASESNTDAPYSYYLTAMAETRAEVRALRKALRLKGIAHEEVKSSDNNKMENTVTWDSGDAKISGQQIALIKDKCNKLNIDIEKFAQTKGDTLEKLSKDDGAFLIQVINQYQTKHKVVPEELLDTGEGK